VSARRAGRALASESGLVMPIVIAIIAIGTLVVFAMLQRAATVAGAGANDLDTLAAMYAADAAVNTTAGRLITGPAPAQAVSTSTVSVGDFTAAVEIRRVAATSTPTYDYVDPQVGALAAWQSHDFVLREVRPGSMIRVNWAFTGNADWSLDLYRGEGASRTLVATSSDAVGPGALMAGPLAAGGAYTVVFTNTGASAIDSRPFAPGSEDATWLYVQAGTDFIVTARVEDVTLTAYLAQSPGLTNPPAPTQRVRIESWKPE